MSPSLDSTGHERYSINSHRLTCHSPYGDWGSEQSMNVEVPLHVELAWWSIIKQPNVVLVN